VASNPSDIEPASLDMDLPEIQSIPMWLSSYFKHVERTTIAAIHWYLHKKRSKSRWSRYFRSASIVLGTIGALIPLLTPITGLSLAWGYTALGLAGGCVALDKLFGFSSSWMRYINCELELQHLLSNLQSIWLIRVSTGPHDKQTEREYQEELAALLVKHSEAAASAIRTETASWTSEFNTLLNAKLEHPTPAQDSNGQVSPPSTAASL